MRAAHDGTRQEDVKNSYKDTVMMKGHAEPTGSSGSLDWNAMDCIFEFTDFVVTIILISMFTLNFNLSNTFTFQTNTNSIY